MMIEHLAYCGIMCDGCPVYWATRVEDRNLQERMRVEITRIGKRDYGLDLDPGEAMDCDGCRPEKGRKFSACRDCRIRRCAREKGFQNCVSCDDYACDDLKQLFEMEPAAKHRLDFLRSTL